MLYPQIENTVKSFDFKQISEDRKAVLRPLIDFIQTKVHSKLETRLNLICTHNSRRSHLSQVWAQTGTPITASKRFMLFRGTEATALFPMALETLKDSGFNIKTLSEGSNPIYSIKYSADELPVIGFSKPYDDDFNPESGFVAIMTCSQADGGCPFIAGAEKRIPITFEDPKISDGTPQQKETYLEP